MTDALVAVAWTAARDLFVIDLWDGTPPAGPALLQVEPRRWWVTSSADADAIAPAIAGHGALMPIGGGLARATLTGPGWRALLMVSGCFDAEAPAFAPGHVAATVIHHVPVWIAPIGDDAANVYCANSYVYTLADLWARAGAVPASLAPPGRA